MKVLLFYICIFFQIYSLFSQEIVDDFEEETQELPKTQIQLNTIQEAFKNSKKTDNIKTYTYNKNHTYKIRMREFMNTLLVLPKNEIILGWDLGDEKNFPVMPQPTTNKDIHKKSIKNINTNVLSLRNFYSGADTSLSIIGESGKIYSFYLFVESYESKNVPDMIVYINLGKDDYILPKRTKLNASQKLEVSDEYLREITTVNLENPLIKEQINLKYEIINNGIPIEKDTFKVFDDGYWTYFRLSKTNNLDKLETLPVIYKVQDGVDSIINTRTIGGYLIAETTGSAWQLVAGETWLCVFRNDYIDKK